MRKSMFKKLHSSALTEQLANYAPTDEKLLARSEQKLQRSRMQDDEKYEEEVHGVAEYPKHRLAPIISLAACAVLVAGIGGMYAVQQNKPDIAPGSAEQLAAQKNVPPFGDISGLELQFCEGSNPIPENISPEFVFTISAEQQAALSDALCAFSWGGVINDEPPSGSYQLTMYFSTEEGSNIVHFFLDDNMVSWISPYPETDPNKPPSWVGVYYQIDGTLSNCIREIVLNNNLISYVPDYVMDDFSETEDQRYLMYSAISSSFHFDMFNLNEADILFMTENTAPEYYTIPPAQKMQLAEYFSNREAWEDIPKDLMGYDNPETGEKICMFFSDENYKTIVTFWSDGYITEQASESSFIGWWKTKPGMFSTVKMLTEKKQDSFSLPYADYAEVMENRDAVLEIVFGEKGAPFGDITNESIRGTCAAYAPYMAEIPEDLQQALAEAMNNAVWREVDLVDTPTPDGEFYGLSVYNGGEPYALDFYGDNLVGWSDMTGNALSRKFRTSVDLSGLVRDALNYPDVYDHLTWVEPDDQNPLAAKVWDAVNAAAAEADLSAYQAVVDEFNQKYGMNWKIVTPEDFEPREGIEAGSTPLYADAISEILAMTPEEYRLHLEELYGVRSTYGVNPTEAPA